MSDTMTNTTGRKKLGRHKVRDTGDSILYRMPAGFAGDVVRSANARIEPCVISENSAPLFPGAAVVIDGTTNKIRLVQAGDGALTAVYGFVVRVYPTQQTTGGLSAGFGAGQVAGPGCDVLRSGYMMTPTNGGGSCYKGQPINIWIAASAGAHVQGQPEFASDGGNTITLASPQTTFNGPGGADGEAEIAFYV